MCNGVYGPYARKEWQVKDSISWPLQLCVTLLNDISTLSGLALLFFFFSL